MRELDNSANKGPAIPVHLTAVSGRSAWKRAGRGLQRGNHGRFLLRMFQNVSLSRIHCSILWRSIIWCSSLVILSRGRCRAEFGGPNVRMIWAGLGSGDDELRSSDSSHRKLMVVCSLRVVLDTEVSETLRRSKAGAPTDWRHNVESHQA